MPVSTQIAGEEREDDVVHREDDPVRLADVRDCGVEEPHADEREQQAERAADAAEQHGSRRAAAG